MGMKIFSVNMDHPNLNNAIKIKDVNPLNENLKFIFEKAEKFVKNQENHLKNEDEFVINTLNKVRFFYMFVVFQTILTIILWLYQVFSFRKLLKLKLCI